MKLNYEEAELEIINFSVEDVITTSEPDDNELPQMPIG